MNKRRSHEPVPNDEQAACDVQAASQAEAAARAETDADKSAAAAAGADSAGTDPERAALEARLAKAEDDLRTMTDRFLRLMAEYDNFRKRTQKEREGIYQDSVASVAREWLPVVDNLGRAEQSAHAAEGEGARRIAEGVSMVLKQAAEALERLGIREIDCLGQPFDPQVADAVLHVEDESAGPSTVVEILQKGYMCGDRVIRHCMVKVAN